MQPKIIADFETQLAGAVSAGNTSFTVASMVDDDGNTAASGRYFFTIDSGNSSKEYVVGEYSGSGVSITNVKNVSRQGTESTGFARTHRVGAKVVLSDFATYKAYIDAASIAGASDASTTVKGIMETATTAEIDADNINGATGANLAVRPDQLAASKYGTRLPSAAEKTALPALTSLTGAILPYAGRTAPTGYLLADGSAVSRTTYASLFAVLCPSQTFTVTIASPGVFTSTAHGFVAGDIVRLTTTGALPTGLATGTDYYVLSAGLTADNFRLALSPTASAINTSGSQSGTHTVWLANWGFGDGSTTFNVPDLRGLTTVGRATSAQTFKIVFESGAVNTTNDTIDVLDRVFPSQGQAVVLTTTGGAPGGLTASSTYYVIRSGTATTIKLASSLANANAGTAIDLTTGGSGVHTLTFTTRTHPNIGYKGGEDSHAIATTELASHSHTYTGGGNLTSNGLAGQSNAILPGRDDGPTQSAGGNTAHNNMQPFVVVNYIVKT